ncbi:hypothetical protein ELY33_15540 [Vreelandella andesensis]|uniref:Uncharacterized protein n=1 Tax=Vreelandella andesensis TaxID=447567 RepID=A0A433KFD8_9GAMM|nr:hypothetical protein [Halomonas andesensis]RUR27312.1 hypothetical protein ELY33_15540 [Halomonas andesensis]
MALSPWHVAARLSFDDVAALLTGFDISLAKTGNIFDHEIKEYKEWCRVIICAAKDGYLTPYHVEVLHKEFQQDLYPTTVDEETGDEEFLLSVTDTWWVDWRHGDVPWQTNANEDIRITIERQEVCRWLRASGIKDDDIPEALRVMPAGKNASESENDELHPRREATYQRIIAALMALQYGYREIRQPYEVADELLDDLKLSDIRAPASRNTLGPILNRMLPVQKADLD